MINKPCFTLLMVAAVLGLNAAVSAQGGPSTLCTNPGNHVIFPSKGQTPEQQKQDELDKRGIRLVVAQVLDVDPDDRYELQKLLGEDALYGTLDDVVEAYQRDTRSQ